MVKRGAAAAWSSQHARRRDLTATTLRTRAPAQGYLCPTESPRGVALDVCKPATLAFASAPPFHPSSGPRLFVLSPHHPNNRNQKIQLFGDARAFAESSRRATDPALRPADAFPHENGPHSVPHIFNTIPIRRASSSISHDLRQDLTVYTESSIVLCFSNMFT